MPSSTALVRFSCRNVGPYTGHTSFFDMGDEGGDRSPHSFTLPAASNIPPLIPTSMICGSVSAGKSIMLRAMTQMRSCVLFSIYQEIEGLSRFPLGHLPFLGSSEAEPSQYTISIVASDGILYEYGFSVDAEGIEQEWASWYPKGRRAAMFTRTRGDVRIGQVNERRRAIAATQILTSGTLLLSALRAIDHAAVAPLAAWFKNNLRLVDEKSLWVRQFVTASMLSDQTHSTWMQQALRCADPAITLRARHLPSYETKMLHRSYQEWRHSVSLEESHLLAWELPDDIRSAEIVLGSGEQDSLPALPDPSTAIREMTGLIGPLSDTLNNGTVLLVDDLGKSFPPDVVSWLCAQFNAATVAHPQLIFAGYDIPCVGNGITKKWAAQKTDEGHSSIGRLIC